MLRITLPLKSGESALWCQTSLQGGCLCTPLGAAAPSPAPFPLGLWTPLSPGPHMAPLVPADPAAPGTRHGSRGPHYHPRPDSLRTSGFLWSRLFLASVLRESFLYPLILATELENDSDFTVMCHFPSLYLEHV